MTLPKTYAGIGSRETPEEILGIMTDIALKLELTLRTGGAPGADRAFLEGAKHYECYVPWRGFSRHYEEILPTAAAHIVSSQYHPAWTSLSATDKKFHARNAMIILGKDLITPVEFVVCWTKDGKLVGGTAQGLRIATAFDIPIWNLAVPAHKKHWIKIIDEV